MARTRSTFLSFFSELAGLLGYELDATVNPAGIGAQSRANLLRHFNLAYRRVYESYPWEDSWEDGVLSPTAGVLPYSAIGDAHIFNLYSADPRPGTTVEWISPITAKDGIYVGTTHSTLYGFWRPAFSPFTGTDDNAETIDALRDAVISYGEAAYYRQAGQHQTAASREKDGDRQCEDLQALEFNRLQTKYWLRRKD
jgi:hypothetical protein